VQKKISYKCTNSSIVGQERKLQFSDREAGCKECKPGGYFSNPGLRVWRPPNKCTQLWTLGNRRAAGSYHSVGLHLLAEADSRVGSCRLDCKRLDMEVSWNNTRSISLLPLLLVTACALATSSCISDVPSQCDGQNFDPSLLPHFSTDLNETWNQERPPGYDTTCKIWLMWDDWKGVCVGREFSVTFCVLSILFFVFLLTPTGHTRRPITTDYGSKRVFLRKVSPFVGLDNKK